MKSKTQLASIFVILSFLLTGLTCQKKVDAFECVLITVDSQGSQIPVDRWSAFCVNKKTDDEKQIPIQDLVKCIRTQGECKWVLTDLNEREIIYNEYKNQCGGN